MPGATHSGDFNVHQPLRRILDQLAQKIGVIALGDRFRKVDLGVGHRALLRCRRSLNNPKLRRSTVAASKAARCATPKAQRAASYTTGWDTAGVFWSASGIGHLTRDEEKNGNERGKLHLVAPGMAKAFREGDTIPANPGPECRRRSHWQGPTPDALHVVGVPRWRAGQIHWPDPTRIPGAFGVRSGDPVERGSALHT